MSITQNYVDYGAGNDATGDGSIGAPWKTLQWAYDHLTRNTTDGNQVNLKAGTAHVNAAALDLTTFIAGGALSGTAPLILRGYTATAGDGGMAEVDCGGAAMWAATTYDYMVLAELDCHSFGNNHGIYLDQNIVLWRVKAHKGASSPSGKYLIYLGANAYVAGCCAYDAGAGAARGISTGGSEKLLGNYVRLGSSAASSYGIYAGTASAVIGNIVLCEEAAAIGIRTGEQAPILGNVCYNSAAGTAQGINFDGRNPSNLCMNNILVGWSGVGGEGIYSANNQAGFLGYNAFYSCTGHYTIGDQTFMDLSAKDISLVADPFVSAVTGDFSLTEAAKTLLRDAGWPEAYLGAHANTDGHFTIGAVQYGPTSGGLLAANKRGGKQ